MSGKNMKAWIVREKNEFCAAVVFAQTRGKAKVQWLMLLAFHDVLGVGERRFMQVMERYDELLEEYKGYQRDEIADQKLTQAVQAILPNHFSQLYE